MKKKITLLVIIAVALLILGIGTHEASVRYFPDKTCIVCHEMKEPIRRWKESGTAKNHTNCAGCHFNAGFAGWMDMNISSAKQLAAHFKRNPEDPLKPKAEPLFLKDGLEPGYWSDVPNSRCFKCKDVKNHKPIEQLAVHNKLINDISKQPCKDCHNHEMLNGQKFYEKVQSKDTPMKPAKDSG